MTQPVEHHPAKMVKEPDGEWHIYCVCGDPVCPEEWDYSVQYVASSEIVAAGVLIPHIGATPDHPEGHDSDGSPDG